MLIATICIGDSLVTLVRVVPLIEETESTFNLSHTDIPTDKVYTYSIVGENNAMLALAAWIVADESPPYESLTQAMADLRNSPMHKFMP